MCRIFAAWFALKVTKIELREQWSNSSLLVSSFMRCLSKFPHIEGFLSAISNLSRTLNTSLRTISRSSNSTDKKGIQRFSRIPQFYVVFKIHRPGNRQISYVIPRYRQGIEKPRTIYIFAHKEYYFQISRLQRELISCTKESVEPS